MNSQRRRLAADAADASTSRYDAGWRLRVRRSHGLAKDGPRRAPNPSCDRTKLSISSWFAGMTGMARTAIASAPRRSSEKVLVLTTTIS